MTIKTLALAAIASLSLASAAHAVAITATSAVGATTSPFTLVALGNAGINGFVSNAPIVTAAGTTIQFTPDLTTPLAGLYDGSVSNVALSAYSSTSLTPTNYLVAEPNDPVTFTFATPQNRFNLLWGSVDSYNSVVASFDGGAPETITGSQILTALGSTFPSGKGAAFVSFLGSGTFSTVTLRSTTSAFEFVPGTAMSTATGVPEPASLALLGAGLAGIGCVRRRRQTKTA